MASDGVTSGVESSFLVCMVQLKELNLLLILFLRRHLEGIYLKEGERHLQKK